MIGKRSSLFQASGVSLSPRSGRNERVLWLNVTDSRALARARAG